jgi:hypothetical protein
VSLILAEELLLLGYDDEAGTRRTTWDLANGLAGALLLDLGEAGCVAAEGKHLTATGRRAPEHPLLAETLALIANAAKPRNAKEWLGRLGHELRPLEQRVAQGLVDRGVLTEEERRVLKVFRTTRYPEADPEPERALRARLAAILLDERDPGPQDALLLSILMPYDLVKRLVPRERRREAGKRAKEIADQGVAGKAVEAAVKEVQAAILLAITVSTTTAAITTTN